MGKAILYLLVISFTFTGPLCYSQTAIKVSDPRLEMVGNTIHISYDILNSNPEEKYTVGILIKDEEGNIINAGSLDGDIGEEVRGGSNKQITWDLEVDQIEMNADIYVKIRVKAFPPPEPVVAVPPEVQEAGGEEDQSKVSRNETEEIARQENIHESASDKSPEEIPVSTSSAKQHSRTGLLLQSVALPGLGLSRYNGGPHWIRGVLGYGCIAGSLIANQAAVSTYEGIIDQAGYEAKNSVYEKSLRQDQTSEVLAYTAVVIWVSDLIWTVVGTSDMNKRVSSHNGLWINSTFDPISNTPLIAFTYRF